MTYDEWKLETPEDEEARINHYWRNRSGWRDYRDAERCWKCGADWDEPRADGSCYECGAFREDEPVERDPDDARDDAQDREMNR